MLKCPFCQYDNEDGALFCEQCKSDLGGVGAEAVPAAAPVAAGTAPMYEQTVPLEPAGSPAAIPLAGGEPLEETVAMATPMAEAEPVMEAPATDDIPVAEATPTPFTPQPPPETLPADAVMEAAATVRSPAEATVPAAPTAAAPLPVEAQPKLVVLRGLKINLEYPIYEGLNFVGRADEKPVDIDLEDQEPPDRIWSSRQHCCISFENGVLSIEDLNSSNGTFVNRTRVYPGQKRPLNVNDVIQIGTVQLKVKT